MNQALPFFLLNKWKANGSKCFPATHNPAVSKDELHPPGRSPSTWWSCKVPPCPACSISKRDAFPQGTLTAQESPGDAEFSGAG